MLSTAVCVWLMNWFKCTIYTVSLHLMRAAAYESRGSLFLFKWPYCPSTKLIFDWPRCFDSWQWAKGNACNSTYFYHQSIFGVLIWLGFKDCWGSLVQLHSHLTFHLYFPRNWTNFSVTYRIVSLVLVFSVLLPANGHPPLHHQRLVHLWCPKLLDTGQTSTIRKETHLYIAHVQCTMTMQRLTHGWWASQK